MCKLNHVRDRIGSENARVADIALAQSFFEQRAQKSPQPVMRGNVEAFFGPCG